MSTQDASRNARQLASGLITLLLLSILVALGTVTEFAGDFDQDRVGLYFLESLFTYLPVGAGLFAGLMARIDMKALTIAAVACVLLMVGQDFLPGSDLTQAKRRLGYFPTSNEWIVSETTDVVRWTEGGSFRLVIGWAAGRVDPGPGGEAAYPEGHPRIQVGWALYKLGYLLTPFIAIGFVVGLRVWVERHLRFRTRSSERLFGFGLSWIVGPTVPLVLMAIGDRSLDWGVSAVGLAAVPVPFIVFAVAAAVGWHAGFRAERTAADLDTLPGDV